MRNVVTINAVNANVQAIRQDRQVVAGMATLRSDLALTRLYSGPGTWSKRGKSKPSSLDFDRRSHAGDHECRHAGPFCRHERPHESRGETA